jgi:hypothetical protein
MDLGEVWTAKIETPQSREVQESGEAAARVRNQTLPWRTARGQRCGSSMSRVRKVRAFPLESHYVIVDIPCASERSRPTYCTRSFLFLSCPILRAVSTQAIHGIRKAEVTISCMYIYRNTRFGAPMKCPLLTRQRAENPVVCDA